jgi:hypothetical protein
MFDKSIGDRMISSVSSKIVWDSETGESCRYVRKRYGETEKRMEHNIAS